MEERKIKVLHVLTDKNIGGAGRWLLNYLAHCDRTRFAVKVVLPKDSLLIAEVEQQQIPVIVVEDMQDASFDRKAKAALVSIFKEEKPKIVHTHASLTARMAAKQAKVPCILNTKHCMEGASGSLPKKIVRRMLNQRYSHKIIAVSKAVRHSMIAGGTNPKQIVTIYNGITPLSPISKEEKVKLLTSVGGNPNKKAVGIVARLEEVKDHKTFLYAVKEILERRDDICFYVIGDGSLREELIAFAKLLQISEHVVFTGFVKEVERMEACLDLNVITSKEEALCISLIETMSLGIPAVGTNTGGVGEVIQDEKNGYLVPVGDAKALAKRIEDALGENNFALGEEAKKWVEKNFLASVMVENLEKLYLED